MNWKWRNFAAAAAILLSPATVSAHLVSTGFGPFYDGLAHPFVSPEDLLPVVALGVWGGLLGASHARWIVLTLPAVWLLGAAAGETLPAYRVLYGAELVFGILVGVAAAARLPVSRGVLLAAGGVLGLLHGLGATAGDTGSLVAASGTAAAVGACFAVIAGQVASFRADWPRIAARALSSWTAAIGLLQLGWMLRG